MNISEIKDLHQQVGDALNSAVRYQRLLKLQTTLMPLGYYWANHEGQSGIMIVTPGTPNQAYLGDNDTYYDSDSVAVNYFEEKHIELSEELRNRLAQMFMKIPHASTPGRFDVEVSDFLLLTLGAVLDDHDEALDHARSWQEDEQFEEWLAEVKRWCELANLFRHEYRTSSKKAQS